MSAKKEKDAGPDAVERLEVIMRGIMHDRREWLAEQLAAEARIEVADDIYRRLDCELSRLREEAGQ